MPQVARDSLHQRVDSTRPAEAARAAPFPAINRRIGLIADITSPTSLARQLSRTLSADRLALAVVSKLAAVVDEEAARAGELIRLTRDHPERELLV
jgi:hypothetical protein